MLLVVVVVFQSLSCVQLFETPWTTAHQAPLSSTISQSLLKFISIELVMLSNHLILCCPLLLLSVFPRIRVFSSELALQVMWPKYWSFSLSSSPPVHIQGWFHLELTGLISLQSKQLSWVLQHHSLKASILQHSAFFMIQLISIHDYWKNHSFDYTDFCRQGDVSTF